MFALGALGELTFRSGQQAHLSAARFSQSKNHWWWLMSAISDALVPSFSGRIPRRTYWLAIFAYFIFSSVLPLTVYGLIEEVIVLYPDAAYGVLCVYLVLCSVLYFSALVRRLHDIGRSGLWALVSFIPLIGFLFAFILGCLASAEGANRYGPNPDNIEASFAQTPLSTVSALSELERMLEKGLISREEFDREKAKILGSGAQPPVAV